jgi:hypothetical protein
MRVGVPAVEASDDGHCFSIRSPGTEPSSLLAFVLCEMATQVIVKADVTAFVEQVDVTIAKQ